MEQLNELYGGARVSYIFNEVFSKTMLHVTPFEGVCVCVCVCEEESITFTFSLANRENHVY